MGNLPSASRSRAARAWAGLVLACALLCVQVAVAGTPKSVLILHSFGRDFAPYDAIVATFRTTLARRLRDPITFVEANLDFRRGNASEQPAFTQYLRARFDEGAPDLVVTVGPVAARFYEQHRDELFASAPLVVGALDARLAQQVRTRPGDAVVAGRVDLPALVDNILQLLPDTSTIAVVVGASDLEQFWAGQMKHELEPFAGRVRFELLDHLSLAQMRDRVATLPPHSAVLFALLIVDAAGIPHERLDALAGLRAVANAPIFGIYENELGNGIVGGPYNSQRVHGENMATAALEILGGLPGPQAGMRVNPFEAPVYDWRELQRWGIDAGRLPPGSTVRFRPPSIWEEHRAAVIATAGALIVQAALIVALLVQRSHRRRAEQQVEGLAGRLVTAHEDERRRLARELHDDVTQRLAALAIRAATLKEDGRRPADDGAASSIRQGLVELSEDVHALSYRLHPSVIEDLGLAEALKVECDRVARQQALHVQLDCRDVPRALPPDTALCLFRVAQEALRNVARHAQADAVNVSVAGRDGGVALTVQDNGAGFDVAGDRRRATLGLESMRERVRLLGGRLDIESDQGKGTTLRAWVPLEEHA